MELLRRRGLGVILFGSVRAMLRPTAGELGVRRLLSHQHAAACFRYWSISGSERILRKKPVVTRYNHVVRPGMPVLENTGALLLVELETNTFYTKISISSESAMTFILFNYLGRHFEILQS